MSILNDEPSEIEDQYHTQINNKSSNQIALETVSQSDSIENVAYQQPMNQQYVLANDNPQNDVDDILKKSSTNYYNYNESTDNNNHYITSSQKIIKNNDQLSIKQQIENPVIEQNINQPIYEQVEDYNTINEYQNNIHNSYSYPIVQKINNPVISSGINENNDINTYASVNPISKHFITPVEVENNNNIYQSFQPNYRGFSNQIISQYPQNKQVEYNIINSTPLPEVHNILDDYQNQTLNNTIYTQNNYNNIPQQTAQVIPIDEEKMKNPEIAKNVLESERHIEKFLKKNNKSNKNYDNLEIYNSPNPTKLICSKKKNNINGKFLNNDDINDLKNFSPDFWRHFYNNKKDEVFFNFLNNSKEIIKDKIIQNKSKNETYYGDINKQREKHGFGRLITPEMERIGSWKNDQFHGWGREIRKTGEIYEGRFIDGELNGKGIYKDGAIFYVGEFVNYIKHGKGELFNNTEHYVGNFNNNKMDGNGRIEIYEDGVYEGNFNNGEIYGYGVFKYNNGDFYEGEMKNGKMNGYGKLTLNDGKCFEGYFADGEFKGDKNLNLMYNFRE